MAVSYRESLANLLHILEVDGGYREPLHQVWMAQARTLLAIDAPAVITVIRCNRHDCPSRLELAGDHSERVAAAIAAGMMWWTDGTLHLCPACKER
jgi:hypothetical protein